MHWWHIHRNVACAAAMVITNKMKFSLFISMCTRFMTYDSINSYICCFVRFHQLMHSMCRILYVSVCVCVSNGLTSFSSDGIYVYAVRDLCCWANRARAVRVVMRRSYAKTSSNGFTRSNHDRWRSGRRRGGGEGDSRWALEFFGNCFEKFQYVFFLSNTNKEIMLLLCNNVSLNILSWYFRKNFVCKYFY